MQHRITQSAPLLDKNGRPAEPGYATSLLPVYDRAAIRAGKMRIKEWDYYLVANDRFALALTIADNGYMGLDSVSLLDFDRAVERTVSKMRFFPMGKTDLPAHSAEGATCTKGKGYEISFVHEAADRVLTCRMEHFTTGKPLEAEIRLSDPPADSMVVVTPFKENERAFYLNQKINCLHAKGWVRFDAREYRFDPEDSFGVLDWGRGVWPYRNTWYWSSASGIVDGECFGFNLGYGFGDTAAATENMLFWKGRAHKLEGVEFHIPQTNGRDDYMKTWQLETNDGRLRMSFIPVLDRYANTSALIVSSCQHQMFGRFTGTALLDDGTELQIRDFFGFAEKVTNRW